MGLGLGGPIVCLGGSEIWRGNRIPRGCLGGGACLGIGSLWGLGGVGRLNVVLLVGLIFEESFGSGGGLLGGPVVGDRFYAYLVCL